MANRIATDTTSPILLADNDRLYVPRDVSAIVTSGIAITSSEPLNANNFEVVVDGTVVSLASNAILMDDDTSGVGGNTLVIGASGIVRTLSYPGNSAIYMLGSGNVLQNRGEITGTWGGYMDNFDNGIVENHGILSGQSQSGLYLAGAASARVVNTGLISGAGGIVFAISDGRVDNSGEILATSASGSAIAADTATKEIVVVNSGQLSAPLVAVLTGGFNDRVVNSGSISGDVSLGGGDDTYRGGRGTVEGTVLGGAGEDLLRGGRDEDTLDGGADKDTLKGGDGDDILLGGAGNDLLSGGRGDDTQTGGAGRDTFIFGRRAGDDVIADFQNGLDLIDLTAFGLRPADFAAVVAPALSDAGGGATVLDLSALGGEGSVLIEGLGFAAAGASDFLL